MTRGPISRGASRLAGASLTLLVMLLLATGSAEAAGCGRHAGADPTLQAQLDRLLGADLSTSPRPDPGPAQAPCSGPGCSEAPPAPPGPAPAGPVVGPQEWASLTADPIPGPPPAAPVAADEPGVRPVRVVALPERPPRPPA